MENICYSGGAQGADKLFGECAAAVGHEVVHWTFGKKNGTHVLSEDELKKADGALMEANRILKRTFPTQKEYVNNLLRRNFYHVIYSERIYAVTPLDVNYVPYGGTAWAIAIAMIRGFREIYVFDYCRDQWIVYNATEWKEIELKDIPVPSGRYAGIGSRDLPENGQQAIKDLYDRHSKTISGPNR